MNKNRNEATNFKYSKNSFDRFNEPVYFKIYRQIKEKSTNDLKFTLLLLATVNKKSSNYNQFFGIIFL